MPKVAGEAKEPRKSLAASMKWLREQQGWSQSELATILGFTQSQISRWEKGDGEPSLAVIRDLCIAADYPLGPFLDSAGYTVDSKITFREAAAQLATRRIAAFQEGILRGLGLEGKGASVGGVMS